MKSPLYTGQIDFLDAHSENTGVVGDIGYSLVNTNLYLSNVFNGKTLGTWKNVVDCKHTLDGVYFQQRSLEEGKKIYTLFHIPTDFKGKIHIVSQDYYEKYGDIRILSGRNKLYMVKKGYIAYVGRRSDEVFELVRGEKIEKISDLHVVGHMDYGNDLHREFAYVVNMVSQKARTIINLENGDLTHIEKDSIEN